MERDRRIWLVLSLERDPERRRRLSVDPGAVGHHLPWPPGGMDHGAAVDPGKHFQPGQLSIGPTLRRAGLGLQRRHSLLRFRSFNPGQHVQRLGPALDGGPGGPDYDAVHLAQLQLTDGSEDAVYLNAYTRPLPPTKTRPPAT